VFPWTEIVKKDCIDPCTYFQATQARIQLAFSLLLIPRPISEWPGVPIDSETPMICATRLRRLGGQTGEGSRGTLLRTMGGRSSIVNSFSALALRFQLRKDRKVSKAEATWVSAPGTPRTDQRNPKPHATERRPSRAFRWIWSEVHRLCILTEALPTWPLLHPTRCLSHLPLERLNPMNFPLRRISNGNTDGVTF
jgi:hypothetical protein